MYPLTLGVAIETKELWEDVQACLQELPVRVLIEQQDLGDWAGFLDRVERMRPDVLLIEIAKIRDSLEEVVRATRAISADVMLIALHATAEAETILAALRAGVNEYLHPPLQASLRKALERKSQDRARHRDPSRPGGRTLAFFSAKGGCGATTIACHTAVELGREQDRRVLLADLDIDTGMIAFLMKVKTSYSIADALNNMHRLDISYWKALVSNGLPGLEIIPAPVSGAGLKQYPQQDQMRTILGFLRSHYDFTVLDLGRSLGRLAMHVLEESDEAYLITTLEVPSLHQAKQIVQTLRDTGYGKSRLRLVLNRVPKRVDVTPAELEKMLGLPVFAMLPNEYPELYECYSEGKLLPRGSNLGQNLARFAHKVAGIPEQKSKRKFSIFG